MYAYVHARTHTHTRTHTHVHTVSYQTNNRLFQFIADHIETNTLIKEDYECQELIKDAFKYHSLPDRRSTLQSPRTKPRKSTVGMLYAVGGMDNNKGNIV